MPGLRGRIADISLRINKPGVCKPAMCYLMVQNPGNHFLIESTVGVTVGIDVFDIDVTLKLFATEQRR